MSSVTLSRLALRGFLVPPRPDTPTTTASADFSLRFATSAFQPQGEISPGKNAHLHRTIAASTPLRLGHKSFANWRLLALLGKAFYAVLVHRLTLYAPHLPSHTRSPSCSCATLKLAVTNSRRDLHPQVCAHAGARQQTDRKAATRDLSLLVRRCCVHAHSIASTRCALLAGGA